MILSMSSTTSRVAHLLDATSRAAAVVLLAAITGLACSSGTPSPECNGCSATTNPTPFTPGALPGSVASLQGGRCATTGSSLFVFGNQLLATRIADPSVATLTFAPNDGFVVYWSICNVGAGTSAAVSGPPQGLNVVGPGGFNQSFTYAIPALAPCACVTPIPQAQLPSGLTAPGSYTASLVGLFNTSATLTVN
jgi:hypothetical protein